MVTPNGSIHGAIIDITENGNLDVLGQFLDWLEEQAGENVLRAEQFRTVNLAVGRLWQGINGSGQSGFGISAGLVLFRRELRSIFWRDIVPFGDILTILKQAVAGESYATGRDTNFGPNSSSRRALPPGTLPDHGSPLARPASIGATLAFDYGDTPADTPPDTPPGVVRVRAEREPDTGQIRSVGRVPEPTPGFEWVFVVRPESPLTRMELVGRLYYARDALDIWERSGEWATYTLPLFHRRADGFVVQRDSGPL